MIISKVNKRKSCTPFLFKEFQESVLNRVKDDHCVKATTSHENKRRRTVCLARKNGVFGFTLQTYGIRREIVDPVQNDGNEQTVQLITYIDYVALDSPACYAGLKRGDVILAVNGLSMESSGHEELVSYIASQQAIRMVVLFEDCSQKIDLNLRYLKLKEILEAKSKELALVELQEKIILSACTEGDLLASLDYRAPTSTTSLKPCHHSSPGPLFKMTPPPPPLHRSNVKRLSAAILMMTTRSTFSSSGKRKTLLAPSDLPTSASYSALSSNAFAAASRPYTLPLPSIIISPSTCPLVDTLSLSTAPTPHVRPTCSSPILIKALTDPPSPTKNKLCSENESYQCLNPPKKYPLRRSATFALAVGKNEKPISGLTRTHSERSVGIDQARPSRNIMGDLICPNRCSTPVTKDPSSFSTDFEILNLSRSPHEKTKASLTNNIVDVKRGDEKGLRFTRL